MEIILFIPINDTPTWYSKETTDTVRGRFFLYRHKLSLYLTDTVENKVIMFPFLFNFYRWFERKWNYIIRFSHITNIEEER